MKDPYSPIAVPVMPPWADDNWRFGYDEKRHEYCGHLSQVLSTAPPGQIHLIGVYGVGKSSLLNRSLHGLRAGRHAPGPSLIDWHSDGKYYSLDDEVVGDLVGEWCRALKLEPPLEEWEDALRLFLSYRSPGELIFRVAVDSMDPSTAILGKIIHDGEQLLCIEMHEPLAIPRERGIPGRWGVRRSPTGMEEITERLEPSVTRIWLKGFDDSGVGSLCYSRHSQVCEDCAKMQSGHCSASGTTFRRPGFHPTTDAVAVLKQWAGTHPLLLHMLCYGLDLYYQSSESCAGDIRSIVELVVKDHAKGVEHHVQHLYYTLPEHHRRWLYDLWTGDHIDPAGLDRLRGCGLVYEEDGVFRPIKLLEGFLKQEPITKEVKMALVRDMIEAYFFSLGDPKEPGRVVLKRVWGQIFPKKHIANVYVDSLFEAIQKEPKTKSFEIKVEHIREMLKYKVDLGGLDLQQLTEGQFFDKMISVLSKGLPFPGSYSEEDQKQIARRLMERTTSIFTASLCSSENEEIWQQIMLEEAQRSGVALDKVYEGIERVVPQMRVHYDLIEEKLVWIEDRVAKILARLESEGVVVADVGEDSARVEERLENIGRQNLNATEEGNRVIDHYRETLQETVSTPRLGARDEGIRAAAIENWEDHKRLHFRLLWKSSDATHLNEFLTAIEHLGALYSDQYDVDDLVPALGPRVS